MNGLSENVVERSRYKVDRFHRIDRYEDIMAIGDIGIMRTELFPDRLPMLAPVANQQGIHLAKFFKNDLKQTNLKPFEYHDKGVMATMGRNRAVADLGKIKFGGLMAWLVWMFVHLLSLVGFRNRLSTFSNWSYNYFNFDKGIRPIIREFKR